MSDLIIAIVFQIIMTFVLKWSEDKNLDRYGTNSVNYALGALISFFMLGGNLSIEMDSQLLFLVVVGFFHGLMYVIALVLTQYNILVNGVALATMFSRLSIVVPIIFSLIIFKERPGPLTSLGLASALIAIIIINLPEKDTTTQSKLYLLPILLLAAGLVNLVSKIYSFYGDPKLYAAFTFVTFLFAFIFSFILFIYNRQKIGKGELKAGILIGIPNQLVTLYLIRSLGGLPSYIAFPLFSIVVIFAVIILNFVFFKETLTKRQIVGLAFICLSLIAINS